MKCPYCHPTRPRGRHCPKCLQHVYLVQNRDGERFLVTHRGQRGCRGH